jgi:hypothetical protein
VTEVDFLGHKITQEGLKMDDHNVWRQYWIESHLGRFRP